MGGTGPSHLPGRELRAFLYEDVPASFHARCPALQHQPWGPAHSESQTHKTGGPLNKEVKHPQTGWWAQSWELRVTDLPAGAPMCQAGEVSTNGRPAKANIPCWATAHPGHRNNCVCPLGTVTPGGVGGRGPLEDGDTMPRSAPPAYSLALLKPQALPCSDFPVPPPPCH